MPADHEPDTEFLHMVQANDHLSVQIGDKKYYVPDEESGEVSYDENCEYNLNEEGYLDCYLYSNIRNLCCFTDDFDFGVKAYDADCDITYYTLSQSNQHLDLLSNTGEIGLQFYPYDWEPGTYKLTPVFRVHGQTSDSDWKEIELLPDQIIPTITLKGWTYHSSFLVFMEQPWGIMWIIPIMVFMLLMSDWDFFLLICQIFMM